MRPLWTLATLLLLAVISISIGQKKERMREQNLVRTAVFIHLWKSICQTNARQINASFVAVAVRCVEKGQNSKKENEHPLHSFTAKAPIMRCNVPLKNANVYVFGCFFIWITTALL